jgi:MurNAc alpha-1-phosphate uridylyltransferase
VLDRLADAGVETAVVNVHAFADQMRAHLARRVAPRIVISDETDELLETGGGLKRARPLLGDDPVLVANIDAVWIEDDHPVLGDLAAAWAPQHMDVCLLLAPLERTLGFDGAGDAFLDPDGRLRFRGAAPRAPYAYAGFHITRTTIFDDQPQGPWSLMRLWPSLAEAGRMGGCLLKGLWMHVGDPGARDAAERRLSSG